MKSCLWISEDGEGSEDDCVQYREHLHITLCTKCEFLPFWNRIFTIKTQDSTWQTGTYDCEASSHQVKSEFASQNYQIISVSKLRLSHSFQWLLLVAARLKFKYQQFTQCTTGRTWNILWWRLYLLGAKPLIFLMHSHTEGSYNI